MDKLGAQNAVQSVLKKLHQKNCTMYMQTVPLSQLREVGILFILNWLRQDLKECQCVSVISLSRALNPLISLAQIFMLLSFRVYPDFVENKFAERE